MHFLYGLIFVTGATAMPFPDGTAELNNEQIRKLENQYNNCMATANNATAVAECTETMQRSLGGGCFVPSAENGVSSLSRRGLNFEITHGTGVSYRT